MCQAVWIQKEVNLVSGLGVHSLVEIDMICVKMICVKMKVCVRS